MFSESALPVINGVSISVDALVTELRNRGHSVHLFVPHVSAHRDADPNTHRLRSIDLFRTGYPVAIPPFYRALRTFRRYEFDLIHTHTPFLLGMVGLRWAESHSLPVVSTYHTLYDRYAHYFPYLPKRYVRFRVAKHTNFYYNHVDEVITPSDASRKWLLRHSVHTPTTVIPTGILPTRQLARADVRQELGISADTQVLLFVGRLAKEKNLSMLIDAVKRVMDQNENVRLILVGDGPFRDECSRLTRLLGIGDRVRFAGFVERNEVDHYYAAADLFVFASITETQGLVVQEAMTYGLPAIAVSGGGAAASIVPGENGFVVKNEAGELASAISRVLADRNLLDRLATNAARCSRDWSIGAMAESVLRVYDRVLTPSAQETGRYSITV